MKTKSIALALLGFVIAALVILGKVRVVGGMPTNLPVFACEETMQFYAPKCIEGCTSGTNLVVLPVQDAFKKGFKPSKRCLDAGWFSEYEVSLLIELIDRVGIWQVHPWNQDGSWRK